MGQYGGRVRIMADYGTGDLWWLKPSNWLTDTKLPEGIVMANQNEQFKQKLALQLSELDLQKREQSVRMQGQLLQQQLQRLQLADVDELQKGYTALAAGQEYEPRLTTHTAALTWQNAKAGNDLQVARSAAQAARNKRAAETISEVPEAEEFIFPEPGKINGEALARWSAVADLQKESRNIRLRTAAPEIAAQTKIDIEAMREKNMGGGEGGGPRAA